MSDLDFGVSLVAQPFMSTTPADVQPCPRIFVYTTTIQQLYNNHTTTYTTTIQQLVFRGFSAIHTKNNDNQFLFVVEASRPRNIVNMQLLYGCCIGCCMVVVWLLYGCCIHVGRRTSNVGRPSRNCIPQLQVRFKPIQVSQFSHS